jgi:hypothetical protein
MENFKSKPAGPGLTPYILSLIVLIISASLYYRYIYLRNPTQENRNASVQAPVAPPRVEKPRVAAPIITKTSPPLAQPKMATEALKTVTNAAPEEAVAEKVEPTSVNVDFDLVTRDGMERMSQEGEGQLDIGTYSVSVVPQFKAKYDGVRADEGFHQLGTDSKSLTISQPSMVFRGGKEPKGNEAIGLYVEVTPQKMVDRGMEFKLSIKRSLPELSGVDDIKVVSQDYDQTMVIPKGWGAVIAKYLEGVS